MQSGWRPSRWSTCPALPLACTRYLSPAASTWLVPADRLPAAARDRSSSGVGLALWRVYLFAEAPALPEIPIPFSQDISYHHLDPKVKSQGPENPKKTGRRNNKQRSAKGLGIYYHLVTYGGHHQKLDNRQPPLITSSTTTTTTTYGSCCHGQCYCYYYLLQHNHNKHSSSTPTVYPP
ncbi:hypothetical protein K456DRAFT_31529 [Colletotrichum gloeosporioides 23]|nr:hypothetical protein K456DRAFT_31529 [Colletotrichum gloeosporioides 23]